MVYTSAIQAEAQLTAAQVDLKSARVELEMERRNYMRAEEGLAHFQQLVSVARRTLQNAERLVAGKEMVLEARKSQLMLASNGDSSPVRMIPFSHSPLDLRQLMACQCSFETGDSLYTR